MDAIKVGVGPGRGCRTRLETAAGVPQLQAIREAWCAVGNDVPIIADGGIAEDKDIFLALVCGASSVMLGSALSGTDESPGHLIEDPATHKEERNIYYTLRDDQGTVGQILQTFGLDPDRGHIVNVSSVAALRPDSGSTPDRLSSRSTWRAARRL